MIVCQQRQSHFSNCMTRILKLLLSSRYALPNIVSISKTECWLYSFQAVRERRSGHVDAQPLIIRDDGEWMAKNGNNCENQLLSTLTRRHACEILFPWYSQNTSRLTNQFSLAAILLIPSNVLYRMLFVSQSTLRQHMESNHFPCRHGMPHVQETCAVR